MGNVSRKYHFGYQTSYNAVSPADGTAAPVFANVRLVCNSRRIGADNPLWQSNVRRGTSATNYMKNYDYQVEGQRGFVRVRLNWPGTRGHGQYGYSDAVRQPSFMAEGVPVNVLSNARNKAAIGIRKKIHEQNTSFTGLTMLGELRETIHMLRHPAESMRAYSHNYFKGMHAKKLKYSKQKFGHMLANSWLEFTFGLAPFMSEIGAIADTLIPSFQEPSLRRLSFTAQDARSVSSAGTESPVGLNVAFPYSLEQTDEVSCRYTVWYRVEQRGPLTAFQALKEYGGFNLSEVIPTVWELLPWSFFLDYFGNIGDVLATNLVSLENVAFAQENIRRTATKRYLGQCSRAYPTDSHYPIVEGEDTKFRATLVESERLAASIPFTELRFELPGTTNQFLNMAALAQNLFVPENVSRRRR